MNKTMTVILALLASLTLMNSESLMAGGKNKGIIYQPIVSGNKWLVTTDPGPACPAANCLGWTNIGYNDSQWETPALSGNSGGITTKNILPGTKAYFMWHPSDAIEAYFRYKFTLNSTSRSLPLLAEAFVVADDYYELWVNGNFVTSGLLAEQLVSSYPVSKPQIVDITPYLQNGQNVIAIRANDGDCKLRDPGTNKCLHVPGNGLPTSLVFKSVFFDGVIETTDKH